jgi:glycine dehydrogenase subunit 2
MHEFVATGKPVKDATGVRAMDVAKRLIDLGYHPSTIYFPLVVEEAMMVEPTETETKATLEGYAAALCRAADEARTDPALLLAAPVSTPVGRLDEARAARHLKLHW